MEAFHTPAFRNIPSVIGSDAQVGPKLIYKSIELDDRAVFGLCS
jgi:hypothetical protein